MEKISVDATQIEYIRKHYGKMRTELIAESLNIPVGRLRKNISLLGIRLMSLPKPKVLIPCNGMYNEADYLLSMEVP